MNLRKYSFLILFLGIMSFMPSSAQSPYETSWAKDGIIMGVAVANGVGAYFANDSMPDITKNEILKLNRENLNWLDKSATYNFDIRLRTLSDYFLGLSILSPLALLAMEDTRKDAGKLALMYSETFLLSSMTTLWFKGAVRRIRPFLYNPEVPMEDKLSWKGEARRSFFSGHTSMSFASMIFLAKVYNDYFPDSRYTPYVWTGAVIIAGITGTLRYLAGVHFPTDVLTGAAVGTIFGLAIPELHKIRSKDNELAPGIYDDGMKIGISFAL